MNRQESLPDLPVRPRRMLLRRQQTFGKYEFSSDAPHQDDRPQIQKQHSMSNVRDSKKGKVDFTASPTHRPEIKQSSANASPHVNKLKKKLGRTDSSLVIVSDNNNGTTLTTKVGSTQSRGNFGPTIQITRSSQKESSRNIAQVSSRGETGEPRAISTKEVTELTRKDPSYFNSSVGIKANCSSCPNLASDTETTQTVLRSSKSNVERLCKTAPAKSPLSHRNRLNVPDVFTTSKTHSNSFNSVVQKVLGANTIDVGNREFFQRKASLDIGGVGLSERSPRQADTPCVSLQGHYRHSAPDLGEHPEKLQQKREIRELVNLSKSLSDAPERFLKQYQDSSPVPRASPRISQVLDFLYLGNVESAYDQRLLCKNQIGSMLDLSNIAPEDIPANRYNPVPCTCGIDQRHMRAILRLNISETDIPDIESHFDRINKFIGAQEHKKKVLVFCNTAKNNLSVLVVAQYLMHHRNMNFRKAYSQIMKGRSDIELSQPYYALLQKLEFECHPDDPELITYDTNDQEGRGCASLMPREAWTSC